MKSTTGHGKKSNLVKIQSFVHSTKNTKLGEQTKETKPTRRFESKKTKERTSTAARVKSFFHGTNNTKTKQQTKETNTKKNFQTRLSNITTELLDSPKKTVISFVHLGATDQRQNNSPGDIRGQNLRSLYTSNQNYKEEKSLPLIPSTIPTYSDLQILKTKLDPVDSIEQSSRPDFVKSFVHLGAPARERQKVFKRRVRNNTPERKRLKIRQKVLKVENPRRSKSFVKYGFKI